SSVRRKYLGELAGATAFLTLAAVIGKPITFGREVTVAHTFGANEVVDFVIITQFIPVLFAGLISGGAALSLPALSREASGEEGQIDLSVARAYTNRILFYEAIGLVVTIILLGPFLALNGPVSFPIAFLIMLCLSAQAWCDSATAMYAQVLRLDGYFGRAALQFALNGALSALLIVILGPALGIAAWPLAMFVDSLWQTLFLRSAMRAIPPPAEIAISVRHVLVAFGPALALFGLTMIYGLTDRLAGIAATAGTLALWTWALQVGNSATGMVATPVATVVFSRSHARGDAEPALYGRALSIAVGMSLAVAVVYFLIGPTLVNLVFGGSRISPSGMRHLVELIRFAVLAAIPLAVFTVTSRACAARGAFKVSISSFAIGGVLYPILVLAMFPRVGYLSLGIGYLIAATITAVLSLRATMRRGWLVLPSFSRLRGLRQAA
ncbi:MAG TPA: lipid II flippase MurJ, partial [Mycobacterium sp.]|nr:lipid II flippase MurJ [Mycobacterium sp.]